jgi:hypothetical protein
MDPRERATSVWHQKGHEGSGSRELAKPRPEKKRDDENKPGEQRVLPMQIQVGDRLTDETGEYEIIGRPYTTNAGKDVHARVKRVDDAEVTMIRSWAAHERVAVTRAAAEEGKR